MGVTLDVLLVEMIHQPTENDGLSSRAKERSSRSLR
jgi:hypothetical protein